MLDFLRKPHLHNCWAHCYLLRLSETQQIIFFMWWFSFYFVYISYEMFNLIFFWFAFFTTIIGFTSTTLLARIIELDVDILQQAEYSVLFFCSVLHIKLLVLSSSLLVFSRLLVVFFCGAFPALNTFWRFSPSSDKTNLYNVPSNPFFPVSEFPHTGHLFTQFESIMLEKNCISVEKKIDLIASIDHVKTFTILLLMPWKKAFDCGAIFFTNQTSLLRV